LVDYTNLLRAGGLGKDEALLKAGPVRLRPILMTAFSTIAGMMPIAIGLGSGAESRAPMGTCVVGGMLTSTVLTLIVIPVIYSVADDAQNLISRLRRRRTPPETRSFVGPADTNQPQTQDAEQSGQVRQPEVALAEAAPAGNGDRIRVLGRLYRRFFKVTHSATDCF